ncbi:MAG: hypothetical protein SAJ37_13330 [Oscillatoria sp. PMC 1068.18]|nr:hypothetical protein [Oscillatoria sp. PMC 1068.18]
MSSDRTLPEENYSLSVMLVTQQDSVGFGETKQRRYFCQKRGFLAD